MITALQSPEGDVRIMEGSAVRMRIVGFRVDQREMVRVSCVQAFRQRQKCVARFAGNAAERRRPCACSFALAA